MFPLLLCLVSALAAAPLLSRPAPEKKREVTGIVVDATGKPMARAALFLIGVDADGEPGLVRYDPDGQTDADGRFVLVVENASVQSGQILSIGIGRGSGQEVKTLRQADGSFPRIDTWKIPSGGSLDLGTLSPPAPRKRIAQAEGKLVEVLMVQSADIAYRSSGGPAKATRTGKPQSMFVVRVGDRQYGGKCGFAGKNPYRAADWPVGEKVSVRFDAKGTRFWVTNRKGLTTPACVLSFEEKANPAR